jgi:hypothetical protein
LLSSPRPGAVKTERIWVSPVVCWRHIHSNRDEQRGEGYTRKRLSYRGTGFRKESGKPADHPPT